MTLRDTMTSAKENTVVSLMASEEVVVRRIIRKYIHDHAAADDIFQEVTIKVLKNIETVREQKAIRGWLFCIARNTSLDYLRKANSTPKKEVMIEDTLQANNSQEPSAILASKERIKMIEQAIDGLSKKQKEAIVLRSDGMKYEEIAKQLNISRQAAEVRVHRARIILKETLADLLEE